MTTNKTLTITPPEGYEIDQEHSTFECIKFKKIQDKKPAATWSQLKPISGFYIDKNSNITYVNNVGTSSDCNKNTCNTKEQAEGLLALSQLSQLYCDFTKDEDKLKHYAYIKIMSNDMSFYREGDLASSHWLSFMSSSDASWFLSMHKDLISTASVWS